MPSTNAPAFRVSRLCKSFGPRRALQSVDVSLAAGERLALLGPNGAGKTTLVRCLSRRTVADSGQIRVFDRSLDDPTIRQAIGLVPQEIAIYSDLTTRENLSAFARFHGLSRRAARDRVEWALQWTGLSGRADDFVGRFSGGMQRRVNLACGVLHRPGILLLDEPTVGVDPQSRQRIFSMLDDLNRDGTSILLTTHHLDEAQQQCDRIVIMDQGRVIADGNLDQLIQRTVGSSRLVRMRVDRPLDAPIKTQGPAPTTIGRRGEQLVTARVERVSDELPLVLASARNSGYEVSDVEIQSPSLHHVFLHLTGYELRD